MSEEGHISATGNNRRVSKGKESKSQGQRLIVEVLIGHRKSDFDSE
jgi:hypothetical protein